MRTVVNTSFKYVIWLAETSPASAGKHAGNLSFVNRENQVLLQSNSDCAGGTVNMDQSKNWSVRNTRSKNLAEMVF